VTKPLDVSPVEVWIGAPTEVVWSVLADGWSYAGWVVGASRIREVDRNWPQTGSRIHHSVGAWPLLLDDITEVLAAQEGSSLLLRARAWPTGEAQVRFDLTEAGAGCRIAMREDTVAGPAHALLPGSVRQALIRPRNAETLRRFGLLARGRHTAELAVPEVQHTSA